MDFIRQNYGDDFDFHKLEPLVIYVISGDKKGFLKEKTEDVLSYDVGSGFVIYNDGQHSLLVASGHVVEQASSNPDFKVYVGFHGEGKDYKEAFIQGDISEDIALLVTKCGKEREWLDVSKTSRLEVGMRLYMSSFAMGHNRVTSTSGELCCKKVKGTTLMLLPHASSFIEMCIGSDKGSSGAPIVDDDMRLVGIMSCSSLSEIYINPEHSSLVEKFNLKADGAFKYGVNADKLRLLIRRQSSTLPSTTSFLNRLAHILEKGVMQGSKCGDGLKQEIQVHDGVGDTVKRKCSEEEELCGTTSE